MVNEADGISEQDIPLFLSLGIGDAESASGGVVAVKLPYCLYTLCTVGNRAEATFARLRYNLGGDRPSQTAHLKRFQCRIHGYRLEF